MTIFCPLCGWRPQAGDRWQCRPGCRYVWDTFATRGRCPGCSKQWRLTRCLRCRQLSPHDDWYHDDLRREIEEILRGAEEPEPVPV